MKPFLAIFPAWLAAPALEIWMLSLGLSTSNLKIH